MPKKRNLVVSITIRAIVSIALVVVALAIYWILSASRRPPQQAPDAQDVPRVRVLQAEPVTVHRRYVGYGTAQALASADVPARVTATVESIPPDVREGAGVEAGDVLVQLDASDFQRQLESAEQNVAQLQAQLEQLAVERAGLEQRLELAREDVQLAQAELARVQRAVELDAANPRELDAARQAVIRAEQQVVTLIEQVEALPPRRAALEAQLAAQQAAARLARQNVERATIISPIGGIVQTVDVEVGESVTAGERVARVVDPSRIEVPLRVPAAARPVLRVGDPVVLQPAEGEDLAWTTRIDRISPEDDEATRTMAVYTVLEQDLDDDQPLLAPGRFVRGTVRAGRAEQRWVVPRRAMRGERVMVVEDGVLTSRSVDIAYSTEAEFPQLGIPDVQWVVLAEPLQPGTLIMLDAGQRIPVGARVRPILADEPTPTVMTDRPGEPLN